MVSRPRKFMKEAGSGAHVEEPTQPSRMIVSPVHPRMDGKSLNLVVHVLCFFSRAHTCAQFDDREVVYSENGAFATTSAKLGDVYPSTYRTPKSRTMLSKVDSGFRRAMLQRHSLSPFLSARRGNSARIAPCLSCGIRSRPAPRTSAAIPEWVVATSGSL